MTVHEIVSKRGGGRENLLAILRDLQQSREDNSLCRADLEELARIMAISVSDLVGTVSFYSMFSLTPRGRHIIRLCDSPPCYIMGEENLRSAIRERLGIDFGETTADRCFTLESSSCLGACGVAPVMMVDEEIYGNLTREKVGQILDRVRAADQQRTAGA